MQRNRKGQCFIEMVPCIFLMMVFAAMAVNLTILFLALSASDLAARDCARAAATQTSSTLAQTAANSMLKAHPMDGKLITSPVITSFIYQDYAGSPPVNTTPYVQVTTQVTVNLPATVQFFGVKMFNNLVFNRTYLFPIVKEHFYG